jgi:hypothetical protein
MDSYQLDMNTLNGTLQDTQAQAQEWQSEQVTLATLEAMNAGAIGNLQVAQIGQ